MAAAAGVKVGIKGALMRNTGTYGSPTWAAVALVRDVTPVRAWDTADASARESRAKLYAKTMIEVGATAVVRADDVNTGYQALYDASNSPSSVVDLLIIDGPLTTEGSAGVRAEFLVSETGAPQEAGGVIYATFDLKPAWTSNGYPSSVDVGSTSALTLTAF